MKYLIWIIILLGFTSCDNRWLFQQNHSQFCYENEESVICTQYEGGKHATKTELDYIKRTLWSNFEYTTDYTWHYNEDIFTFLRGDCEDVAITYVEWLIGQGINPKTITLIVAGNGEVPSHVYVGVVTKEGFVDNFNLVIGQTDMYYLNLGQLNKGWIKI
jgi:predicted transglutaminase-like cysteine proteinase